MSDFFIEQITGTQEQEDPIWRMVSIASKFSVKPELALSKQIRTKLGNIAAANGETLKRLVDKIREERMAFFEESILPLIQLLDLNDEQTAMSIASSKAFSYNQCLILAYLRHR